MALIKVSCVEYGDYFVNPDNVSFISSGEIVQYEGKDAHQIFIHFAGGKESCMIYVADKEATIKDLNP